MQIDLTGRVALVTGSTRGIGRSIAGTLASCGASVAVVGRDQSRADGVAAELGGSAQGFACDVSDVAQVTSLIEKVEKGMGSLDILVNNAGLTRDNILLRMKDDDWDAASKAGLIGLTKSVAREFASRNILANVIAPGYIETDMTAAMTPEAQAAMKGMIPLERLGTSQDVANMVAFLASEHASYITGQVLVVDGGLVM